ncbi:FecR domain-containing protein [Novosphingobium sp. KA1]|uniref:FecR family protein n=1 Tax=Novosphingobium sp. (strain KA1) TaxID=164608 RepID=UPI001A8D2F64|nr:FecR domain-containing protein [Novosphingobium sp. KA1]
MQLIDREAIDWHVRLRHGGDEVWEAFAEWLAADPRNQAAYDEIAEIDFDLDDLLPQVSFIESANDDDGEGEAVPFKKRRFWAPAGLVAASLAAVLTYTQFSTDRYEIITRPGEMRQVAIAPGSSVTLNGGTKLILDRKDSRFASLEGGEALFRVKHDAARPFTLRVGDNQVQDVGTVFNVVHSNGAVRVAVGEGEVLYNPRAEAVKLMAGEALVDGGSGGMVEVKMTDPQAVGAWERGQLIYSAAPLSQVAADLSRKLGVFVTVEGALANRQFSGTLSLDGSGAKQLPRIAVALGVGLEERQGGWIMKPGDSGAH